MKKFSQGVRRRAEIVGVCTTLLASSVLCVYTKGGNDDKAKKEVKLANTFIKDDDKIRKLNDEFKRIAKSVEQNMTNVTTSTTTLTTMSTPTTVLTKTTAPVTTTEESTTAISVTEAIENLVVTLEKYEADAAEHEESDTSVNESDEESDEHVDVDNDVIEECNENITTVEIENVEEVATDAVKQPSGDITDYVSESDYILLCNAVGHEYGSDWVSVQEKALVVEVIMNRVNSDRFPGTIYDVLTQPYQFSGAWGYVNLGCFSYQVTQSVKDSVLYYFQHPDEFTHGYVSFNGDGYRNYFR